MKRKIDKLLNKKVTIAESIGIVLMLLFILIGISCIIIFIKNSTSYYYEDYNNSFGNSKICKKKKDGLYCKEYIKVKWYYKK